MEENTIMAKTKNEATAGAADPVTEAVAADPVGGPEGLILDESHTARRQVPQSRRT